MEQLVVRPQDVIIELDYLADAQSRLELVMSFINQVRSITQITSVAVCPKWSAFGLQRISGVRYQSGLKIHEILIDCGDEEPARQLRGSENPMQPKILQRQSA